MTPPTTTILDVHPYNTFTITCNIVQPHSANVQKQIQWIEGSDIIVANGNTVNITTNYIENSTSATTLTMSVNTFGRLMLTCVAKLQVPQDLLVQQSETAEVIVKGKTCTIITSSLVRSI